MENFKTILKNSFSYPSLTKSIIGISAVATLSYPNQLLAETPIIFTDSKILKVSYKECKERASKAAKTLLLEVQTAEERNLRFKVTGKSRETAAVIYCIERAEGTISIVTTSTYSTRNKSEASSTYDRLTSFMTSKSFLLD